ncbi:MAG: Ppx/GppA family phosphatase [Roseitalea sp.]|jgi:exopolyphosphatase/guanosine-5'-triphosphate,3'-diphosphate pyrophosphatase|nr:Ppx/GppA family phosphatase [Roseitalea sp.]MBO6722948.1 Ppx/GppA family phosphatase [Roseitalea sp.]MBO6743586.1 Ppx/GppA family phosphatase [Roseitalea sp.]
MGARAAPSADTSAQTDNGSPAGASLAPDAGRPDDHDPFAKRPSKRGRRRRRSGRNGAVKDAAPQVTPDETRNGAAGEADANPAPGRGKRRRGRRKRNAAQTENGAMATVAKPGTPCGQRKDKTSPPAPAIRREREAPTAYAALDLGTNNCRLLVAVPTKPWSFRVVDAFSRIVRLGEGLGASGRLSDEAMDRAVGALAVCRDKLTARPIGRTRLIATEACRSAENGAQFLDRVRDQTGLKLEVVDRETEARLAVSGCGSLVDRSARSTVLFDIGGGSSEIAVIDLPHAGRRNLSDNIVAWTSLPVGVVTMAERFGGTHVDAESFSAMVAHAEALLGDFARQHSRGGNGVSDDAFHLIGTSGTVTTLAGIHLGLARYDRRRVDGLWMRDHEVDRINDQILSWSFDERVANPCIGRDRADLVLAGCAILQAIRNVWPAQRLRVADRGLREGLLTEMMAADGVWRRGRHRRGRPDGAPKPRAPRGPGERR